MVSMGKGQRKALDHPLREKMIRRFLREIAGRKDEITKDDIARFDALDYRVIIEPLVMKDHRRQVEPGMLATRFGVKYRTISYIITGK